MTAKTIEVFADINCPFTHVGLKVMATEIEASGAAVEIRVRAWPLEWVNGSPLDAEGVAVKAAALSSQLGVHDFDGFRADRWPNTTIPALNLADAAYERDAATGFAVSLRLRSLVFEEGCDIADDQVLAGVAEEFALAPPGLEPTAGVQADYAEGQRRGVRGSPDFWVQDREFFCPSLDIGHDADGSLTAAFDDHGIREFVQSFLAAPG